MPFEQIQDGKIDPTGTGRVFAGTVTLTTGTATIDYTADLPGVDEAFDQEPVVDLTAKGSDDYAYLSASGTSQATVSGSGGTGTYTVNVTIAEQGGQ